MRNHVVGKLGILIHNNGFTMKDLIEFIWLKGITIPYNTVRKYCIVSNRNYGQPEVWEIIDKFLDKYKIQWDGSDV